MNICFAADRMLGRLARMLRLLGYDTLCSAEMTTADLQQLGKQTDRVILTRGDVSRRFPGLKNVVSLRSDYPPEQLREVVAKFHLDTSSGLWSRCTLCNAKIETVQKNQVKGLVPPRVFELYDQFFRCSGCGHVYWRGSHTERVTDNLKRVLGSGPAAGTEL